MKVKSWRDVYSIHPVANVFPQMSAKELRELARDIQENGLMNKVLLWNVVTPDGDRNYLLDGRSRLDAMELAKLPILGDDGQLRPNICETLADMSSMTAGALAVALNIRRRHLLAEERAQLTAAAFKADKTFRASAAADVPPGNNLPGGTSALPRAGRDDKGRMRKGSEPANKSAVAKVAEAAGVSRPTARKAARPLKAEEELAREQKRAQVIEKLVAGVKRDEICRDLHVNPNFIAKVRKEIGASVAAPAVTSSTPPVLRVVPPTKRKNEDKHMRGVLDELAAIDPDDLSDPGAAGRALSTEAKRFLRHERKENVAV